jgi:hypothetical protein
MSPATKVVRVFGFTAMPSAALLLASPVGLAIWAAPRLTLGAALLVAPFYVGLASAPGYVYVAYTGGAPLSCPRVGAGGYARVSAARSRPRSEECGEVCWRRPCSSPRLRRRSPYSFCGETSRGRSGTAGHSGKSQRIANKQATLQARVAGALPRLRLGEEGVEGANAPTERTEKRTWRSRGGPSVARRGANLPIARFGMRQSPAIADGVTAPRSRSECPGGRSHRRR